jgi:hypothetical protein
MTLDSSGYGRTFSRGWESFERPMKDKAGQGSARREQEGDAEEALSSTSGAGV